MVHLGAGSEDMSEDMDMVRRHFEDLNLDSGSTVVDKAPALAVARTDKVYLLTYLVIRDIDVVMALCSCLYWGKNATKEKSG